MFYHDCGGTLYVDVSESFRITGDINLNPSDTEIKISSISLRQENSGKKSVKFYCSKCHRTLSLDEFLESASFECYKCGKLHSIKDDGTTTLVIPKESGGEYCITCGKKYFPNDSKIKIELAFSRYSII